MVPPLIQDLMRGFHSELGQDNLQALVRKFHYRKGFGGMFRILWESEIAHKCVKVTLVENKKSEEEANRLQKLGDEYFQENNLKNALEMYNQSLMVAPHPPVELSEGNEHSSKASKESLENGDSSCGVYESLHQSYRKRSAVLYELQHYDLCLRDIMLAADCPHQKDELEERKHKCLAKLKIQNGNHNYVITDHFKGFEENISGIPKLSEVNPSMPCFSSACKIAYAPEKGRYIIANESIRPGDVLLVEKAFCTNLVVERHSVQCNTCLRECLAPIPCSGCTMAVFCGPSCRQESLSGAHQLECPVLPTLYAMDMPYLSHAYKLLSMVSHNQWKDKLRRLKERADKRSPEDRGMNESGIYCSDFEAVYNLCTNVEERSRGDLYVKNFIAFVLTKILQLSGRFFVDELGLPVTPSEEDLIFAGQFLLANQMRSSCNVFGINNYQSNGPESNLELIEIGGGIFPTLSLISHSCYPSAMPCFYGRYFVLRASRALQVGDEITVGYCGGSYRKSVTDRQKILQERYQFECTCQACEEEWTTYAELPKELQIKCTGCSKPVGEVDRKCLDCHVDFTKEGDDERQNKLISTWKVHLNEAEEAKERIQNIRKVMTKNKATSTKDLSDISSAIEVLGKYVSPPSWILWDARDTIQLYFHLEKQMAFR